MTGISSYPGNQYPVAYQPAQQVRFADRVASQDAQPSAHQGPPSKSGKGWSFGESACSFFLGGAKNVVSGMFTWQGMATIAAGVALTVATGGAATPFLIAGGLAVAGVTGAASTAKAAVAFANNDVDAYHEALEGAGASTISAGLGVLAARSYYAGGAKGTVGGKAVTLAEEAPKNPVTALFKDMRGQLLRTDGETTTTAWQGLKGNTTDLFNTKVSAVKGWWSGANRPLTSAKPLETVEAANEFLAQVVKEPSKFPKDFEAGLTPEKFAKLGDAERIALANKLQTVSELYMSEAAAAKMPEIPATSLAEHKAGLARQIDARLAGKAINEHEAAFLKAAAANDKATSTQLRAVEMYLGERPLQPTNAEIQSLVSSFTGKGKSLTPADIQAAIKESGGDLSVAEASLHRMESFNSAYRGFLTEKYGPDFKVDAYRVRPDVAKTFESPEAFTAKLNTTYEGIAADPKSAPFTIRDAAGQGYSKAGEFAGQVRSRFSKTPAAPSADPAVAAGPAPTNPGPSIHQFRQALINDGVGIEHGMVGKTLAHEFHNPGTLGTYAMGGAYTGRFFGGGGNEEYYAPEGAQVVGFDSATQQPIFQHSGT